MAVSEKHPHYHKNVAHLDTIDVYRVLERFNVTDPAVQHAIKKLLVAGGRGSKPSGQDIQEAIDSLERFKEMAAENEVEALELARRDYAVSDDRVTNRQRKRASGTAKRAKARR